MVNVPFSAVTLAKSAPVAEFFTLTSAPGTTAPDVSATVPEIVDVVPPPCAYAGVPIIVAAAATRATTATRLNEPCLMCFPLESASDRLTTPVNPRDSKPRQKVD